MPKGKTQKSKKLTERERLIAAIPDDAVRIQVQTPNGKTKWRDLADIRPTDTQARLAEIPAEIEAEQAVIQARYADPQPRLFPVALAFLVPEKLAMFG